MTPFRRLALPLLLASVFVSLAAAQTRPTSPAPQVIETLPPRTSPRPTGPTTAAPAIVPGSTIAPGTTVIPGTTVLPNNMINPGPNPVVQHKVVYRNEYAHFQIYHGLPNLRTEPTAYFTLWHRVHDPIECCDTLVPRTYLTVMQAYTVNDPNYDFWINMEQNPHAIEWRIHKHSCDGCHFQIDYRRTDLVPPNSIHEGWRFYGLFKRDFPQ